MSKEKFSPESNEPNLFEYFEYIFRTYGTPRKSDFDHLGCRCWYEELLSKGAIKEEGDELNPKVTKIKNPYQKSE
jgi:hypothetical protein